MKTVKEIIYKAALTFTLLIMAISPFSGSKPQLALTFHNVLILFFMSVCIGVSFIIFKFKKLPQTVKRIIHICFCYGISLAFFMPFASGKSQTLLVFFMITVIFIAVYPLLMLLSFLAEKLEKKLTFKE